MFILDVILFVFIIFSLFCIVNRQNRGKGMNMNRIWYNLFFVIFFFYGTYFVISGDYLAYQTEVDKVYRNPLYGTHLEFIYIYLIYLFDGDFLSWRYCVYGIMTILLYVYFNKSRIDTIHGLFWFSLFVMIDSLGGRSPIGIISYFVGVVLLCQKKYYLGVLFLLFSYFAHKSIAPLFLLLPFTIISINKKILLWSALFFSVVGGVISNYIFNKLMSLGIINGDFYVDYLSYKSGAFNSISGSIEFFIYTCPIYCFCLYFICKLIQSGWGNQALGKIKQFTCVFVLMCFFLFVLFGWRNPMFYRYWSMFKYLMLVSFPYVLPRLYQFRMTKRNMCFFLVFFVGALYHTLLLAYYALS